MDKEGQRQSDLDNDMRVVIMERGYACPARLRKWVLWRLLIIIWKLNKCLICTLWNDQLEII